MEFEHLGTHCSLNDCKQKDFLPFRCHGCGQEFCLEHRTLAGHKCPKAASLDRTAILCPVCKASVRMQPDEDPNVKVIQHIDSGCKIGVSKVSSSARNPCSFPGCKQSELIPVVCKKCRKNFCLKHRFETDHKCGQKVAPPARPHPPEVVLAKPPAKPAAPQPKQSPTANGSGASAARSASSASPPAAPPQEEEMWCVVQ